jgi:hypothetical protein
MPAPVDIQRDVPSLPGDVARSLSFGFRSLLADLTFIQAVQVLSQRKVDRPAESTVPIDRSLHRLLQYSVDLDPKFAGAYRFAAGALPHETVDGKAMGVLAATQLLETGVRERPDDWHIPFSLGFLQSYYLHDYRAAAASMATAAQQPGAPRYLGFLATRLAARGGELDMAILLAEAMLSQANEAETREEWKKRVADLHMERDLRSLEDAIARYRAKRGAPPPSLEALVEAGELQAIPEEPHGAAYVLEKDGTVRSTGAQRLALHGVLTHMEVH